MTIKKKYENDTPIGFHSLDIHRAFAFFAPYEDESHDLIVCEMTDFERGKFYRRNIKYDDHGFAFVKVCGMKIFLDDGIGVNYL